jgi:hypothetical protein
MSNIDRLNPSDTLIDITKPLPPRTKCEPGSDWFYTDIQYITILEPGRDPMTASECSVSNDIKFDNNNQPDEFKLPNKTTIQNCLHSKRGDLYYMMNYAKSRGQIPPGGIPSLYSMQTGCLPELPKPLCDSNNQVYDSQFQVCVSCRDPAVKPTINNNTPSSTNYINNSISGNTNYQCKNKPILSMDLSGKVISQLCDSGETLSNGVCIINFNATQN